MAKVPQDLVPCPRCADILAEKPAWTPPCYLCEGISRGYIPADLAFWYRLLGITIANTPKVHELKAKYHGYRPLP